MLRLPTRQVAGDVEGYKWVMVGTLGGPVVVAQAVGVDVVTGVGCTVLPYPIPHDRRTLDAHRGVMRGAPPGRVWSDGRRLNPCRFNMFTAIGL